MESKKACNIFRRISLRNQKNRRAAIADIDKVFHPMNNQRAEAWKRIEGSLFSDLDKRTDLQKIYQSQ